VANQIVDNRTLGDSADAVGSYVSSPAPGGASPALDNEVFIEGTGSIGEQYTNTRRGVAYNYAATQDFSNQIFYVWVNCGIVGSLVTQAAGGSTIRFTGPSITDFWEVYVGGNDSWPTAIEGGWVQFAVDMDLARARAVAGDLGGTGGTPPLNTAIQHVGITFLTGAMTKGVDNAWMDAHWFLPKGTPGVLVEGVAVAGSPVTPWVFEDILTQVGVASGTVKAGPGGSFVVNTPIQFGVAGSPAAVNSFKDTNSIILWDTQEFIDDDLYSFKAVTSGGNVTIVEFGQKTGAGTTASGSQGGTIAADTAARRWNVDFSDTGLTSAAFYGASLIHTNILDLRDKTTAGTAIESINTLYIDGVLALVHDSNQLKISVIAPFAGSPISPGSPNVNTETSYMYTNTLSNIINSSFQFNNHHVITISGLYGSPGFLGSPSIPTTMNLTDCTFDGFGADGTVDAAIYNRTGKNITINSSGNSGLTVRDAGSPPSNTTVVADPVTTLITVLDATTQAPIQDARVYVTSTGGSPPTRTYIFGTQGTLTDVNGQVSDSRSLVSSLPITGRVRRATQTLGSPLNETRYKTGIISGTISNTTGFSTTVFLIPDE
jgi:hypothetical protein